MKKAEFMIECSMRCMASMNARGRHDMPISKKMAEHAIEQSEELLKQLVNEGYIDLVDDEPLPIA